MMADRDLLRMDGLRLGGMEGSRCHAKDPRSYPSAGLGFRQAQVVSRAGVQYRKIRMDVVSVHAPEAGRGVL
jgi:hypothetical protein